MAQMKCIEPSNKFNPCSSNSKWKDQLTAEELQRLCNMKLELKNRLNKEYWPKLEKEWHLIQFVLSCPDIDVACQKYIKQIELFETLNLDEITSDVIISEIEKGYYSLAGFDFYNRPIAILEQNKVDGSIDYRVRIKTAIIACEAIYDLNINFMRNGISLFSDLKNVGWSNVNLSFQKQIYSGLQDCVPFRAGEVFTVNVPRVVKLAFSISKRFIRERYRRYGNKILSGNPDVEKWFCKRDQLTPKYGGKIEYNMQDIIKSYLKKKEDNIIVLDASSKTFRSNGREPSLSIPVSEHSF